MFRRISFLVMLNFFVAECLVNVCERFGTSLYDAVTLVKERKLLADEEMIWRAYMIKELVMVRDGVCCLSSDEFFRDDVCGLISYLSIS